MYFDASTMSFSVAGTLMTEPTESKVNQWGQSR
ncbi:hypothetical protein [Psychrobium sp. 1_MG-2023]